MKQYLSLALVLVGLFTSCQKDDEPQIINQGDYPLKEYYLERDPKVNIWGAGMDFVHSECKNQETDLDYKYLDASDDFEYDIKFYTVKSYYYTDNNELKNEGCPVMLLSPKTMACKLGEGLDFFTSLTSITEEMIAQLSTEPTINYDDYKDDETGFYERESLFEAVDKCIIGRKFRSGVLEVPEGKSEEEVQAVYLVKTAEGAYVKFMVKQFKPAKPNEKQTLVQWQVISE